MLPTNFFELRLLIPKARASSGTQKKIFNHYENNSKNSVVVPYRNVRRGPPLRNYFWACFWGLKSWVETLIIFGNRNFESPHRVILGLRMQNYKNPENSKFRFPKIINVPTQDFNPQKHAQK